jgi:FkbM family methyltransferase
MGLEKVLRNAALRLGLKEIRIVVYLYHLYYKLLYQKKWDQPLGFRGGKFLIGKDLSLYPAVRNGAFEELEINAVLPLVMSKDVVWDVGANVGIYSFLLARAASQGHLIAFEPVLETQEKWRENVLNNNVDNCSLEPVALSDKVGKVMIKVNENAHGCDSIELANSNSDDGSNSIEIPTTTGDEFLLTSTYGDPDLIKVDVEGHEPEFLRGSWAMLSRRKPTLMLEVNPTTWTTPERFKIWQDTLDELFSLYGEGVWFEPKGKSKVTSVDVNKLGPHPYSLIFQTTRTQTK